MLTVMSGDGGSHPIAVILMVALVFLLAIAVLLMFQIPDFSWGPPPSIMKITRIEDRDEDTGVLDYNSWIVLVHSGDKRYENTLLRAIIYRNGKFLNSVFIKFSGFIHHHPPGIDKTGGQGTAGSYWDPGEMVFIDMRDGTIRPGDEICVDIRYIPTNETISQSRVISGEPDREIRQYSVLHGFFTL